MVQDVFLVVAPYGQQPIAIANILSLVLSPTVFEVEFKKQRKCIIFSTNIEQIGASY
jgi:hypothetical protein